MFLFAVFISLATACTSPCSRCLATEPVTQAALNFYLRTPSAPNASLATSSAMECEEAVRAWCDDATFWCAGVIRSRCVDECSSRLPMLPAISPPIEPVDCQVGSYKGKCQEQSNCPSILVKASEGAVGCDIKNPFYGCCISSSCQASFGAAGVVDGSCQNSGLPCRASLQQTLIDSRLNGSSLDQPCDATLPGNPKCCYGLPISFTKPSNASNIHRDSIFNQCVNLLSTNYCVNLFNGHHEEISMPNTNDPDGVCSFGARVTMNGFPLFEQQLDLGETPIQCAPVDLAGVARCEACVSLRDISEVEQDPNGGPDVASGCVELSLDCQGVPIARSRVGCVKTPAFARCEAELKSVDLLLNETTVSEDGVVSRCVRATPLSPRVCLEVGGEDCDVSLAMRVGSRTLLARTINVQDLIDNSTNSAQSVDDAFHNALTPREICVQNDLLPCSTCIEWTPSTRPAPEDGKRHIVGCGRLNVTCLGDTITDTDLGCFVDRTVAPRCFEPCTTDNQCLNGICNQGKCECEEGWHGSRCSYQCPLDCSGPGRGVCLPTGNCVCIPPASGANCSETIGPGVFNRRPIATRRGGDNGGDRNGGIYVAATLTSCKDDCNRAGDCLESRCICFDGFAGESCEKEVGSSFLSGTTIAFIAIIVVVVFLVICLAWYALRKGSDDLDEEAATALVSPATKSNSQKYNSLKSEDDEDDNSN